MKKLILSMAVAGMCATGHAQQQFQLSGHIDGIKTDSLIVYIMNEDFSGAERMDTVAMKNGDFTYNLTLQTLRNLAITAQPEAGKKLFEDGNISIMAIPGEKAVIKGNISDYEVTGGSFYQQTAEYKKATETITKEMTDLMKEYSDRIAKGENQEALQAEISPKYEAASKKMEAADLAYIKAHPDADYSALLAAGSDSDEAMSFISERAKNGVVAPYIKAMNARKEKQRQREEAAKKIQPGIMAPEFTLNDINGKPLSLASLRGKYVVLDFWGSWCGWCIKGVPEMKVYYAKYKDKVEFLGIDCNDTEAKWKAAVAKHEIPWLHVQNTKDNDVTVPYAIQGYPTKIVIDPQGKIAKVVVGESPEFYQYLDELFK